MTWPRVGELRSLELGAPGEMRTRLNGLVLAGQKRATAGLVREYVEEEEEFERVGERLALLDDHGQQIATIEVTRVEQHPFGEVPWEFASAEGEGDADIDEWRQGHREFWSSYGTPVEDDELTVCIWFQLV